MRALRRDHPIRIANSRRACRPEAIDKLLADAYAERFSDPALMLRSCELATLAARRFGFRDQEATGSALVGNAMRIAGRLREARSHMNRSLDLIKASKDPARRARVFELAASLCRAEGKPADARRLLTDALGLRRKLGDAGLLVTLIQLAEAHSEQDEPFVALRLVTEASALVGPGDLAMRLTIAHNGANYLCQLGRPAVALAAFERLEPIYEQLGSASLIARRELSLGNLRAAMGDQHLAEFHLRRASSAFLALNDLAGAQAAEVELALLLAR